MTEAAIDLDRLPDLDFTRYAPQKRYELVWSQPRVPQTQPPGELAVVLSHIGHALDLIWDCIVIAIAILQRRAVLQLTAAYHHTIQSTYIAWVCAGFGWGGFIAFPIITYLAR